MNYKGTQSLTIDEFEIEYEYDVDHEAMVMYHSDGTGTPESVDAEITITGLGGLMNLEDFTIKSTKGEEVQPMSMVEFYDKHKDKIYYGSKSLDDLLIEHCLEELPI